MRRNVLSTTVEIILTARAAAEAPCKRLCVFKSLSRSYVSSLCYFVKLNMLQKCKAANGQMFAQCACKHTVPVNCTAHRPQARNNRTRRLFCSRHAAGKYGFLQYAPLPGMTPCRRVVPDVSEGRIAFIFKGRQRQHSRPHSGAAEDFIPRDMTLCRRVSGHSDSTFKGAFA
jgi:hypothetical protein